MLELRSIGNSREHCRHSQNYYVYCVPSPGDVRTGDIVTQSRGSSRQRSNTHILEQSAHKGHREFLCALHNYDVYCVPSMGEAGESDIVTQSRGS